MSTVSLIYSSAVSELKLVYIFILVYVLGLVPYILFILICYSQLCQHFDLKITFYLFGYYLE